jgi:hypothetical protein
MRFKEFLVELDTFKKPSKKEKSKQAFKDLHAAQQQKKKDDFEAKWNTGMPVKVKVKVYEKKPAYKQEDPYEYREFTIDNLLSIRHKLDGITLIDMSSVEDDKSKHDGKITWAIKKDGKELPGGLPEYLHGLPARTRKKPGFDAYDLRREAWTDTPIPYNEAAMRVLEKDIVKGAKFSDGKRTLVVTASPTKENNSVVSFEIDGVEKPASKLYALVLWLNDSGFEKGSKKKIEEAVPAKNREARNDLEAFVKPYIEKLVGKKAGTSVLIPMRVRPKDGKVYANHPKIAFQNAVSLWMGRLITGGKTGWWAMENVNDQKHTNHLKITLKKDHEAK